MIESFPVEYVNADELRKMFNKGKFLSRVKSGELKEKMLRDKHPTPSSAPVPFCSRSQMIAYINAKGQTEAKVHQYLKPNGKLGASGLPDPKGVLNGGILYKLSSN